MTLFIGPDHDPDKYSLVEVRSRGGEGEVWKGSLRVDSVEVPVAVKIILPAHQDTFEDWSNRWHRQAELLRSLQHPGLVTVREVFTSAGPHQAGSHNEAQTLCLVMNWVEGPTLVEWVDANPHRHALESIQVIGGMASAIDYLHSGAATGQPVLHRDIKPANVILTAKGPQLVDFGFVRAAQSDTPLTMVGTPAFIAPEVASGLNYAAASDRFALGATTYFALTGEIPKIDDLATMHATLDGVKGLEGRADLHDHILSMMDRDPQRRPTSCVGWAQNLATRSVIGGFTEVSPTRSASPATENSVPAPSAPTESFVTKHAKALITSGAILMAILLIGSLAASGVFAGGDSDVQALTTLAGDPVATGDTTISNEAAESGAAIPQLLGLPAEDASALLAAAGFTDFTVESRPDSAPADTVIDVTPAFGSIVPSSEAITITVAAPLQAEIPDVIGEDVAEAISALAELGMVNVTTEKMPSVDELGSVIGIVPTIGTVSDLDVPIVITVADVLSTPDLLALTLEDATSAAEALGARVRVEKSYDPDIEPGVLYAQTPLPGEPMTPTVVLEVGVEPSGLFLEDLGYLSRSSSWDIEFKRGDVDGETYLRSLVHEHLDPATSRNTRTTEFNLAKDFDRLTFVAGYDDSGIGDGKIRLEIFLDGKAIHTSDHQLGSGGLETVLDVRGGLRLVIVTTDLSAERGSKYLVLGQATLLGDPKVIATYSD